jgi:hypothetical protein
MEKKGELKSSYCWLLYQLTKGCLVKKSDNEYCYNKEKFKEISNEEAEKFSEVINYFNLIFVILSLVMWRKESFLSNRKFYSKSY